MFTRREIVEAPVYSNEVESVQYNYKLVKDLMFRLFEIYKVWKNNTNMNNLWIILAKQL